MSSASRCTTLRGRARRAAAAAAAAAGGVLCETIFVRGRWKAEDAAGRVGGQRADNAQSDGQSFSPQGTLRRTPYFAERAACCALVETRLWAEHSGAGEAPQARHQRDAPPPCDSPSPPCTLALLDPPCSPCVPAAAIAVIGRCLPPLSSFTSPLGSAAPPANKSSDSGGGFCRDGGRSARRPPQGFRACVNDAEVARRCFTGASCVERGTEGERAGVSVRSPGASSCAGSATPGPAAAENEGKAAAFRARTPKSTVSVAPSSQSASAPNPFRPVRRRQDAGRFSRP